MRIIHVCTSVSDATAAVRQHIALLENGIESYIYTLQNDTCVYNKNIVVITPKPYEKIANKFWGLIEHFVRKFIVVSNRTMPFSFSLKNVSLERYLQKDDIIHIHWAIGFLSLNQYRRICKGYRTVLSFHDNYYFTGGCHVRLGCEGYTRDCNGCPYFKKIPFAHWQLKRKRVPDFSQIQVISPSVWMNENIKKSYLAKFKGYIIPNPLNTDIFQRINRSETRKILNISDAFVVLFGAVNGVDVKYKGYRYLIDALKLLKGERKEIVLMIFGSDTAGECIDEIGFRTIVHGKINSMHKLADIYSAADLFIVPSLEDSFNQTVVESLCCETPVVAFKTGGIVENIEHKVTGYLAEYADSSDLAKGISWVMDNNTNNRIGKNGRIQMMNKCSEQRVSKMLMEVYNNFDKKVD